MKRNCLLLIASFFIFSIVSMSCKKTKGCTDPKALNRDINADKENGTCRYSSVVFYMSVIVPSRPVSVSVNGTNIGTITAQYPLGPGNCIAPGCATYEFKNGEKINWVATEPGGSIWTGTAEPNSATDCMKIRVY
jgi:hypothetical protein